jgi:hypothetical protein
MKNENIPHPVQPVDRYMGAFPEHHNDTRPMSPGAVHVWRRATNTSAVDETSSYTQLHVKLKFSAKGNSYNSHTPFTGSEPSS